MQQADHHLHPQGVRVAGVKWKGHLLFPLNSVSENVNEPIETEPIKVCMPKGVSRLETLSDGRLRHH